MSPLRGPIQPLRREELVDRSGTILDTCWERLSREAARVALPAGPLKEAGTLLAARWKARSALVAVGSTPTTAILDQAFALAQAGSRVYVYGPATLGQSGEEMRRIRHRNLMIRRGAIVPAGEFLVTGRGERGYMLFKGSRWGLELDSEQSAALFTLGLDLFWNEGIDEAWLDGESLSFKKAREVSFDVVASESAAVAWSHESTFKLDGEDLWFEPLAGPHPEPTEGLRHLFTVPGSGNTSRLTALADRGGWIGSCDAPLPFVALGKERGVVFLAGGSEGERSIRVSMNRSQVDQLRKALVPLRESPSWAYRRNVRVGELRGDVWLPGRPAAEPVRDVVELVAADAQAASLADMGEARSPKRPEAPALAKSVRYAWNVNPPRAPRGAKPARLVGLWKEADEKLAKRIGLVESLLKAQPDPELGLLERLSSFLVPWKEKSSGLLAKTSELRQRLPVSQRPPDEARATEAQILQLLRDALALARERKGETEDARAEVEEQRQQREHDEVVRRATAELLELEPQLAAARLKHEAAQTALRSLESDQTISPEERRAKIKAQRREIHTIQGEVSVLAGQVGRAKELKDRPFAFKAGAIKKGGAEAVDVPDADPEPVPLPEPVLPVAGDLLEHDGKLYLALSTWEDVERTQEYATLRKAQQVAREEKSP